MPKTKEFDPLAYIENAFLDKQDTREHKNGSVTEEKPKPAARSKFRKTQLSAPRPRRSKKSDPSKAVLDEGLKSLLETMPKNIEFLGKFFTDSVTSKYYQGEFKETREELIRRLLDPELTLEETSRLLGVCPATIRRYTNRGWLAHHRTKGGQRRFRLSGVVKFVEQHGRLPEE
ncbi:helix-turn-helix domain-containing protein [Kamptonema cortianum]|nr:helix-turn-helix domain-containing protein [Geitlerinema splendidum]MDK3161062.1 helix-turn-helix domain-containing protein [Kamptonema cortianum]